MAELEARYRDWLDNASKDEDVARELQTMGGQPELLEDAFYRELEFGTGGLRGVIGAGTNRMNVYTVGKASQGLAHDVCRRFPEGKRAIAVSYDSRIKSRLFAQTAAGVFAANGIQVHMYSELMPTPMLSWAVRYLGCSAGIMVTASHNPSRYNGYKVYGPDGCQITTQAAAAIQKEIAAIDPFRDVKQLPFAQGIEQGRICWIGEEVITSFIETVKGQSMLGDAASIRRDAAIVYSPLNGTGLKPVLRVLKESGFSNLTVVKEQEAPDGRFPTCPYPNPEIREAMELGIQYARERQAELFLATDPDCDRVGIAVRTQGGEYALVSGNEVGMLLLDYICRRRLETGTMPEHPVFVKTIVTIDMAARIAADYGVKTVDVLTGFKFIGEQIGRLEQEGREKDFILGFEESYGYLSGGYVRDKDGVDGAFLICEMFSYYRSQGRSLLSVLDGLYQKYGYCLNTLHSYELEGASGFERRQEIMERLHGFAGMVSGGRGLSIGGRTVEAVEDYQEGAVYFRDGQRQTMEGLPSSDVLKFRLKGNCSVVVRPSGTEPKLKLYISVSAAGRDAAKEEEARIAAEMEGLWRA